MPRSNSILRQSRQADDYEDVGKGPYTLVRPAKVNNQSGVEVRQFAIYGQDDDTLLAKEWDGVTAGTQIYTILKPWFLRRTPFDGKTRNGISYNYTGLQSRIASKAGYDDEHQYIVPLFVVGDVFTAELGIVGVEGWLARSDGRAWAWREIIYE